MSSTRACLKTRSEKSGAKGVNACTILGCRVRTSITSFWLIAVTSVLYPFRFQMAKAEHGEVRRIPIPRTRVNRGKGTCKK
jgi:hypothetical protein